MLAILLFGLLPFNVVFAQLQNQPPIIQLSIPTFWFADGQIIPITGKFLPNSTINISLSDNVGDFENSTQVTSNSTGFFQTSLGIPLNAIGGGSWHILAVSDKTFKVLELEVNTHGVNTMPDNFPSNLSPLKQFQLGMKADMVNCRSDFQLMIRNENDEPACVRPESVNKLANRGWGDVPMLPISGMLLISPLIHGNTTNSSSGNNTLPSSFMPCDTPYSQNDTGEAVLYMPVNSTGKVCVRYHNLNDFTAPIMVRIFEANNMTQDATEITTWNDAENNMIPTGDSTIVYWIKTGNHAGFYGFSLFCGGLPLAVGYDNNSTLVISDFPYLLGGGQIYCPAQTYDYHIDSLTGIGVKYIPQK